MREMSLELAVHRLLHLGGKVPGHLALGAAQDEGAERLAEHRALGLVQAVPRAVLERPASPQHPGVQELEEAPELAHVVLDGSAR